ncbi:MAG: Rrf2 family transcriptional regulator [Bryobacterales bacterium]|nr:Rrf2 family transcriptional regulator [Bryobacterales bacterium]
MLNKTTLSAIRTLVHIAARESNTVFSPRILAGHLHESPTYLAKITRLLVKAGLLRAEKGAKGGVRLALPPSQITLLSVVEACQGTIVGDYCQGGYPAVSTCSFHEAALQLQESMVRVLSRWSIAQLAEKPFRSSGRRSGEACVMAPERLVMPWPV